MQLESIRRPVEPIIRRVLHFYWRLARGLTVGVRALVVDAEGRVFLVKHSYVSGWHLPGGGVETGETLTMALARELREEGNIELIGAPTLFAIYFNRRVSRRDHVALYVVRSFRQTAPPQPNNEIVAHGFFAPDSLPRGNDSVDAPAHRRSARRTRRHRAVVIVGDDCARCFNAASFGHRPAAGATNAVARRWRCMGELKSIRGETSMRRKILALAAAVALGTATMTTGAMAFGGGAHGGGGGFGGGGRSGDGRRFGGGGHVGGGMAVGHAGMGGMAAGHGFAGGHGFNGGHFAGRHFGRHRGRFARGYGAGGGWWGDYDGLYAYGGWPYCYNNWPDYYGYNSCYYRLRLVAKANEKSRACLGRGFFASSRITGRSCAHAACVQPNRPRSCGSVKSSSGPIGTMPVGLILRWLP